MKRFSLSSQAYGFTLIELLVVIGILAVLLSVVLVAINPARQFAQANDTKRRSDVQAILNAVDQYAADNRGVLPPGITTTATIVGKGAGQVDLCAALVTKYIAAIPVDPKSPSQVTDCTQAAFNTNYKISQSAADSRVTVTATGEITPVITVTR
jgi:type IV pilus assembly protein PilA